MLINNDKFRFRISKLPEGIFTYTIETNSIELDMEEIPVQKISANISLHKRSVELNLTLRTEAEIELRCDRCLKPIKKTLIGSFEMLFLYQDAKFGYGEKPDGVRYILNKELALDLKEDIRETIILSLPYRNVCEDVACEIPTSHNSSEKEEGTKPWQNALKEIGNKLNLS